MSRHEIAPVFLRRKNRSGRKKDCPEPSIASALHELYVRLGKEGGCDPARAAGERSLSRLSSLRSSKGRPTRLVTVSEES